MFVCVCVCVCVCLVPLRCVKVGFFSLMFGIGFIKGLVFRGMKLFKVLVRVCVCLSVGQQSGCGSPCTGHL